MARLGSPTECVELEEQGPKVNSEGTYAEVVPLVGEVFGLRYLCPHLCDAAGTFSEGR